MNNQNEEEIVCLDLETLYQSIFTAMSNRNELYTALSYIIRREENDCDGGDYYDLYRSDSSLRLCCDGEQCKVLEKTDQYVKLIDVENIGAEDLEGIDTSFKLTVSEFAIATGITSWRSRILHGKGGTGMDSKFFTWDDLYKRAIGKVVGDEELDAKDNARNQIGEYALEKFGINIDQDYCPEDAIDDFLEDHKELDYFDIDGNMTAMYDNPIYNTVKEE